MAGSGSKTLPTIGFFTVTENADWGIVGGLLVLNAAARPLEFHCTAPLKPNRAQEILYGPTLRPFLYGEQIGATLAAKAKSDSLFLCTDVEQAMCLRDVITTPLLFVGQREETPRREVAVETGKQRTLPFEAWRLDAAHGVPRPAAARLARFTLGQHAVAVLEQYPDDSTLIQDRWRPFEGQFDLSEPFDRIRQALEEAQRGAAK